MHSDTTLPRILAPKIETPATAARLILRSMELDGLIETQDGDTYSITEKGKAQAALHREGRV